MEKKKINYVENRGRTAVMVVYLFYLFNFSSYIQLSNLTNIHFCILKKINKNRG